MTFLQIPRRVLLLVLVVLLAAPVATTAADAVGAQALMCQGRAATIVGTIHSDRIVGTPGPDVIVALGGNDTILGRGGNDLICSGWGNDVVKAGGGFDRVYGGPGADELTGGPNDDQLFGGKGKDVLIGNAGNDILNGGPRGDSLMGGRGNDTLNGGPGLDRVVGGDGNDTLDGGPGNDVCAIDDPNVRCEKATLATRPATPSPKAQNPTVDRVIHISIDGLRADHVTPWLTPHVFSMRRDGVSTMNARTDPDRTTTLPNHTAQLTGRPVGGPDGHGVEINEDTGQTVHEIAGEYTASVLDVAHDHGLATAMYTGKSKFDLHERTWNDSNGRRDTTGPDNGRNKIDVFVRDDPADAVARFLRDLDNTSLGDVDAYIFVHIRLPDSAGHADGWGSSGYSEAVADSDELVGQIMDHINGKAKWKDTTAFIVTADHGGPIGEKRHHIQDEPSNFTIPFLVSAPGVAPGAELYALNSGIRVDPGVSQIGLTGLQPIRGHEAGNLALDLLGLPPIPGSVYNARHDLRLN